MLSFLFLSSSRSWFSCSQFATWTAAGSLFYLFVYQPSQRKKHRVERPQLVISATEGKGRLTKRDNLGLAKAKDENVMANDDIVKAKE